MSIIRTENMNKFYGDLQVLKDVNMEIEQGEVWVIIGPSGAGKSTLLRSLITLEDFTSGKVYLMPVARVMKLFGQHQGKCAVDVSCCGGIDVVASKTDDRYFLHVVNTDMNSSQTLKLDLGEKKIRSADMYYIDAKPEAEVSLVNPNCMEIRQTRIEGDTVVLPAAAVAAIEICVE